MATLTVTKAEVLEEDPLTQICEAGKQNISDPTVNTNNHAQEVTAVDPPDLEHLSGEAGYPTGVKFWLIILTSAAVLVLGGLDTNIVATAVPSITDHFHTVADVGWYSSAFRLCACAFQFLFGKAYKLFSVKRVFLLANAIFLVGSLLCGTAVTSAMLVVGRAVTGLGNAGLLSGCFVILVQTMPLRRRPLFVGALCALESLGIVAAPLIGGVLTQSLGWRWCFFISLPVGAVTLLCTILFLSDNKKPNDVASMSFKQKLWELDLVSNLLFIPALTSLFLALSWAGTKYPWNSGKVIGPLVTFAVLLAGFLYNQFRRGDSAALPTRILKHRSVIAGLIYIMFTNSNINVLEYYLPTYYQVVRGYTPARSGYMMLPIIIGAAVGAVIHGVGTSKFGYYTPFMLFSSIIMPIAAGLITTFKVDTSLVQLFIYTAFSGFANGIGFSGPQTAVQAVLPTEDVSMGLSVMLFAQSFGPAVSVAIAQVLLTNQLSTNLNGLVPGLNPSNIENNGLTSIATSAKPTDLAKVLMGIDKSLTQMWYLVVGLTCTTMIGSLFMEWRSVKQKRA